MVTAAMKAILSSSVGGSPPGITNLVDRGYKTSIASASSHSFNFDIGAESPNRFVYIEFVASGTVYSANEVNSIVVNGITTAISRVNGFGFGTCGAHGWVKKPSGTTASVVVNTAQQTVNAFARAYTFEANGTLNFLDTAQELWADNTNPMVHHDIACVEGGLVMATSMPDGVGDGANITASWNGVDTAVKDYQLKHAVEGVYGSGFHVLTTENSDVRDITYNVTADNYYRTLVNSFGVT